MSERKFSTQESKLHLMMLHGQNRQMSRHSSIFDNLTSVNEAHYSMKHYSLLYAQTFLSRMIHLGCCMKSRIDLQYFYLYDIEGPEVS